ncbi:MAG: membrane protein insertion efficiency factor YidD [Polyangiaceae bacterium]
MARRRIILQPAARTGTDEMLARAVIAAIRIYQRTVSRLLGPVCRFEPSCSKYTIACVEGHGLLRGGLLSLQRVCKCHPFHPGGHDPPPPPRLTSSPAPSRPSDVLPHAHPTD